MEGVAVILTAVAALMPTLLSAQGMISVGVDVLGLAVAVALCLAVFLELALVSSALLARAAVFRGRSARADLVSTWVFSVISGMFSAAHELLGPAGEAGLRDWQIDARAALAAGVRVAAPLVAAWLWHRILTGDRHDRDTAPTRREAKRHRLMLAVATAGLDLHRVRQVQPNSRATLRAHRRLDRHHRTLLKHIPATDEQLSGQLSQWLSEVGRVEHLAGHFASRDVFPDANATECLVPGRDLAADSAAAVDDPAARLEVAVALVRRDQTVSGQDVADAFTQRGWKATPRTGQRWLAKARTSLAAAASSPSA